MTNRRESGNDLNTYTITDNPGCWRGCFP